MDSELVVSRFTVRFVGCFGALFAAALIGVLATAGAIAQRTDDSQTYPNRAVRIIVPFPPGGPTDILARVLAQRLSEVWGQPVVIENQPGANTAIAAARVAKMPPDGYTLLAAMDVTLVLNPLTARNLAYDPLKDFAPISLASKNTSLMSVRAEDGPRTADRARQGQSRQAQLRRGHHHDAACRVSVQSRGRARRAIHSVQRQRADGPGSADRRGRLHHRRRRHQAFPWSTMASYARWPNSTAGR
jgi:hypothetical protein